MGFVNAKLIKRTAKILFIGPTGCGKTFASLQAAGRIGAYDGEDGLKPYADLFNFGIDSFDTIQELNEKMGTLLATPEELDEVDTVVIDGITVAWHNALREIEDDKGRIAFSQQAELKGHFKEFNDHLFRLGKRHKNVMVTAQARPDWDTSGRTPVLKGVKGDVDQRIWFAFDLVLVLDVQEGVRSATVMKSRYPDLLPLGETITDFDAAHHLKAIYDGSATPVNDSDAANQAEMKRLREQVKRTLGEVGVTKNGGLLEEADARAIWNRAKEATSIEAVAEVLAEVRNHLPATATS